MSGYAQVWSGDIKLAATPPSLLPPQIPPGPRHTAARPHPGSRLSQQDRALSRGSVPAFFSGLVPTSSLVPPPRPPPKLAAILKGPSRQGSIALRKQKELLAGSQESSRRTAAFCRSQTPPLTRGAPPRLWHPPAPKVRCDPTTDPEQPPKRALKKQPRQHQTPGSSSQVSVVHLS